ncbi:MAG: hypothetical protein J6Y89_11585 [Lachnospiraceae bacterium]|nr:hypothetical protein [Lachnospiraceae bacterium]
MKRVVSFVIVICLALGITAFSIPEQAEASTWQTPIGTVTVTHLESDYYNGKYRFRVKFGYDKSDYKDDPKCGLYITNIKLVNSSGKSVLTWNGMRILTKQGGTYTQGFLVDFTKLPSDTYKLCYTVNPDYCLNSSKSFSISVKHSAGKISYNSSKYTYSTDGTKLLKVVVDVKMLKGYTTKFEVYDSSGRQIESLTGKTKISSNDTTFWWTWNMKDKNDLLIKKGSYTVKISCNGKSMTKKLTLDPY